MTGVLLERGLLDTGMHKGRRHVRMKTEIRVMCVQTTEPKDGWEPPRPQKDPALLT